MSKTRDLADFVSAGNPLADGTIDVADINGVTATAAEINILDGVTATTAELNYTDGVTSNLQTQLDAKLPLSGGTMTGDVTFVNITTSGYLRGPASFTIDPAAHGDDTGTVIIAGNLQVDGTTTTINSTSVAVDDLNLTLASGALNAGAANGAGLTVDGANATLTYVSTTDNWALNKPLDVTGTVTATTVDLGNWTITEDGSGNLLFATGGTNKMKLDSSGNLTCVGDITAFGTI